jgi:glycosyltransferase involved in cell wall biosynthesis
MKILFLYSDWRWTGPAEPVLQACKSLQEAGHDVVIAARRTPDEHADVAESVSSKAAEYGLNCTTRFGLNRYLDVGDTFGDLWELPRFLRRERFDILHTNLCHDHVLGALCAKLLGSKRPRVVRSLHRRTVLPGTPAYRVQLQALADGLLTFTEAFRRTYVDRFNLGPEKVKVIPMVIDTDRFRPDRRYRDMRQKLGIPAEAPVVGLVTRFQKYRRMEVFLNAAAKVIEAEPETRFVLLGASSQMEETVVLPTRRLGIADRVITPGYLMDDYVDTLASFDIFSLLMPGFDGTARAVREAMSMGLPCVVSDFGMLPEIVSEGQTGLVVPLETDPFAAAWLRLIRDRQLREQMGQAAREAAVARFQLSGLGEALEMAYRSWLYGEVPTEADGEPQES